MSIWRRIRGALGTALTWATGWGVAGAVLHAVAVTVGGNGFLTPGFWTEVLLHASMGFIGGGAFATGLVLSERHGVLAKLSPVRAAAWGVVAGLAGPLTVILLGSNASLLQIIEIWPLFIGTGVFGAASGAGMAVIARQEGPERLDSPDAARGLGSGTPNTA